MKHFLSQRVYKLKRVGYEVVNNLISGNLNFNSTQWQNLCVDVITQASLRVADQAAGVGQ
ncbi:hypothetical protein CLOSTMETH_03333 [[Clostridium] methylpentosum DSM 5476]|uniref:Uncharacterized protein n=1 Tax=[Clostridium] methylpentosum DSM 5476 TaxID=537013 RepID=C0EHD3_9FIRM|nr:hypothetical protein CLOSTMETH_03333 [[Clostridium] methylpentosum DSM 5476]